jgi:hypothetical protein
MTRAQNSLGQTRASLRYQNEHGPEVQRPRRQAGPTEKQGYSHAGALSLVCRRAQNILDHIHPLRWSKCCLGVAYRKYAGLGRPKTECHANV